METITREMIINDVIRRYPQTIKVFNEYKVDSCCGGGAPIETTAKRDGVDVEGLIKALNEAAGKKG
jgi:regulator of cell morphogenesis and NO signaling